MYFNCHQNEQLLLNKFFCNTTLSHTLFSKFVTFYLLPLLCKNTKYAFSLPNLLRIFWFMSQMKALMRYKKWYLMKYSGSLHVLKTILTTPVFCLMWKSLGKNGSFAIYNHDCDGFYLHWKRSCGGSENQNWLGLHFTVWN